MPYVPEDKRDTHYYIFTHKEWMCRIKNIDTMSVDYIQQFGVPSIGDPMYDAQMANELITTMLTIAEMEDYFHRGIRVHVVNMKDTKKIYEHISNHLLAWRKQLEESLNHRDEKLIEELIRLDTFAQAVYIHAKTQFNTDIVDSIMARKIASTMRVTRGSILGKPKTAVVTINGIKPDEHPDPNKEPDDPYPKRDSLADIFASRLPSSGPKWQRGSS